MLSTASTPGRGSMLRLIATAQNASSDEEKGWHCLEVYVDGDYTICYYHSLGRALFEVQFQGEKFGRLTSNVFEGDIIPSVEEALDQIILYYGAYNSNPL